MSAAENYGLHFVHEYIRIYIEDEIELKVPDSIKDLCALFVSL